MAHLGPLRFPVRVLAALVLLVAGGAARASLLINEIDYDQPGIDDAEFIELFNASSGSLDLSGYALLLINGATGSIYRTIDLPAATLAGGGYFVVCGAGLTVAGCDHAVATTTNLIQNGAPDAVALALTDGTLVDRLGYEGEVAGYTEGRGAVADPNAPLLGLSRRPGGQDTGDNASDFSIACISPGAANLNRTSGCFTSNSIAAAPEPASALLFALGLASLTRRPSRHSSTGNRPDF